MTVTLSPSKPGGEIKGLPPSKSYAHRALVCAALADGPCEILCPSYGDDIRVTISALSALGAGIEKKGKLLRVLPISLKPHNTAEPEKSAGSLKYSEPEEYTEAEKSANCAESEKSSMSKAPIRIDCLESGTTLRFMLPLAGQLGKSVIFSGAERLGERPLLPLLGSLEAQGPEFIYKSENELLPLSCKGKLKGGTYTIDASQSSQFLSALMLSLCAFGRGGKIITKGKIASRPYADMTAYMLQCFGKEVKERDGVFEISGGLLRSPGRINIEEDWSCAVFWLAAGALSEKGVSVSPLNINSLQADRRALDILEKFGASVRREGKGLFVQKKELHGTEFDAAELPDSVPALAVVAAAASGTTVIHGIGNLRFKESDRAKALCDVLGRLGIKAELKDDSLIIEGSEIHGGEVDSFNDHRIAMAAALASFASDGDIRIKGAEAVNKSYPDFFKSLGGLRNGKQLRK